MNNSENDVSDALDFMASTKAFSEWYGTADETFIFETEILPQNLPFYNARLEYYRQLYANEKQSGAPARLKPLKKGE